MLSQKKMMMITLLITSSKTNLILRIELRFFRKKNIWRKKKRKIKLILDSKDRDGLS